MWSCHSISPHGTCKRPEYIKVCEDGGVVVGADQEGGSGTSIQTVSLYSRLSPATEPVAAGRRPTLDSERREAGRSAARASRVEHARGASLPLGLAGSEKLSHANESSVAAWSGPISVAFWHASMALHRSPVCRRASRSREWPIPTEALQSASPGHFSFFACLCWMYVIFFLKTAIISWQLRFCSSLPASFSASCSASTALSKSPFSANAHASVSR